MIFTYENLGMFLYSKAKLFYCYTLIHANGYQAHVFQTRVILVELMLLKGNQSILSRYILFLRSTKMDIRALACIRADILNESGREANSRADYVAAIGYFENTLRLNWASQDAHKKAWFGKGFALTGQENYSQAIECYKEVLKIEPQNTAALNQINAILFKQRELKKPRQQPAEIIKDRLQNKPSLENIKPALHAPAQPVKGNEVVSSSALIPFHPTQDKKKSPTLLNSWFFENKLEKLIASVIFFALIGLIKSYLSKKAQSNKQAEINAVINQTMAIYNSLRDELNGDIEQILPLIKATLLGDDNVLGQPQAVYDILQNLCDLDEIQAQELTNKEIKYIIRETLWQACDQIHPEDNTSSIRYYFNEAAQGGWDSLASIANLQNLWNLLSIVFHLRDIASFVYNHPVRFTANIGFGWLIHKPIFDTVTSYLSTLTANYLSPKIQKIAYMAGIGATTALSLSATHCISQNRARFFQDKPVSTGQQHDSVTQHTMQPFQP
ncbi:MAG: Tetratricopeptide repeat [Gammaproteobacteria bacterium]|nr:Tetratricopeptide repeat [Gammaproteobacteria bacterium]